MNQESAFFDRDENGKIALPDFLRGLNVGRITQEVQDKLRRAGRVVRDLQISMNNGTVTIRGSTQHWFTTNIAFIAAEKFINDPRIKIQDEMEVPKHADLSVPNGSFLRTLETE